MLRTPESETIFFPKIDADDVRLLVHFYSALSRLTRFLDQTYCPVISLNSTQVSTTAGAASFPPTTVSGFIPAHACVCPPIYTCRVPRHRPPPLKRSRRRQRRPPIPRNTLLPADHRHPSATVCFCIVICSFDSSQIPPRPAAELCIRNAGSRQ